MRVKIAAVTYKGSQCNRCGRTGDVAIFDFHHLQDKDETIANLIANNRAWSVIRDELDKCELLCCVCHRLEHTYTKDKLFISEVIAYNPRLEIPFDPNLVKTRPAGIEPTTSG